MEPTLAFERGFSLNMLNQKTIKNKIIILLKNVYIKHYKECYFKKY